MTGIALSSLAVLSLLCLAGYAIRQQRTPPNLALALTCLLLAGIEVAEAAIVHLDYSEVKGFTFLLESFLPAALVWYSTTFGRSAGFDLRSRRGLATLAGSILFPSAAILLPLDVFFYSPDFETERILFLGKAGYWFYLGMTLFFVLALVNIEATFASAPRSDRPNIKYEIIGFGAVLAVLIFYFSQALLYRTINANLQPVRAAVYIPASWIILYSKAFRRGGARITVSRFILYRSVALLSVGVYFVVLGLVGEGMKYFDVPFGRILSIILFFAAGMGLLVILLSESVRRHANVLITKHFFSQKHDYRETWLDLTGRLASCATPAELEAAIPEAYKEIFGIRTAALFLLNHRTGTYQPAGHGSLLPAQAGFTPSPDLLAYFLERNRVWNPCDNEYRAGSEETSFVRSLRAGLVVPLICNNEVEGLVLFGEQVAPAPFTFEDYDLMKIIARQSALLLTNIRLSEELIETRELAALARVSSFVVHDLKNLTYTLSIMVDNAEEYIGNAAFQHDMLATVRTTLHKMKHLAQKLKGLPDTRQSRLECIDLHDLSRTIAEEMGKIMPGMEIICKGASAHCRVDVEEMRKVLVNLVQNGLDAMREPGNIMIETGVMNQANVYLAVSDTGCGMTREFIRHQLFRPFRTTKKTGLGIGLYQCKQIVESFGGAIEATSEHGKGSVFTVSLPLAPEPMTLTR